MDDLCPVYTLQNECHDCYRCVRECLVKAIKIKDNHASVINDKCIACGHCVRICPSNAKRVRRDNDRMPEIFATGKKVIASLAPSWAGVFDYSPSKMIAILKRLGFHYVSETALGAQQVSIQTAKMLKDAPNGLYISSACPVIVDYVRCYDAEYVKNITPIASPALTHAKMLKEYFGQDCIVVFIGPCIGKKNEAARHPDLLAAALTFEGLKFWIKESQADSDDLEITDQDIFVPDHAHEGGLYPIEGGMNETIKKIGIPQDVQLMTVSSLQSFQKSLHGLTESSIDKKIFVEALACDGGCINGPSISTSKATITINSNILSRVKEREKIPQEPALVLAEEYQAQPIKEANFTLNEIVAAMQKIGKYNEDDELNCGGCGYQTCRDLACAMLAGEAESSMCVSYMRKIATRKAAAMLRSMPAAIVMVDDKLNITEANDAFMRMFCGDSYDLYAALPEGLANAELDKVVKLSPIMKSALKSGKDLHKEHYPLNGRLYDITAFTIEPHTIVGAVISDVTQSESDREKIARKARAVISKNISVVQEIACLLGEHMVDTELLLASIAENFNLDKDEDID
ncbi:MAG: [Fe-Fe] hydrogenase large subunit C-terminal domain-containing protein [Bdellovibrionota bacterium]|jgi:iron only hydrogenase large subunit-like protein